MIHSPLPTHNRIHFDPHEVIALVGPWGSGKSTIAAIELAYWCHQYRCNALVVRDTYPALKDSCVQKWKELFHGLGEMHAGPPPTWHWTDELRGFEVLFRSAEDPEDIQKFGSVEVGCVWLEEVCPGLLPGGGLNIGLHPEVLAGVLGRARKWDAPCCHAAAKKEEPHGHRKIFLTSLPPPTTRHWFHQLFYEKKPFIASVKADALLGLLSLYRMTMNENLVHLPPGYYDSQVAFLTTEDQVARFIRGEVGSAYGRAGVYANQWNDETHIARVEPSPGPFIIGIDGGMDASAVWLQPQPNGRMYILAELCTQGLGLEDFGLAVVQNTGHLFGPRSCTYWGDPAILFRDQGTGKSAADYLPFILRPGPQDPAIRYGSVRTWLSRMGSLGPLLRVHPDCVMLIEGFRGAYRFKQAGDMILGQVVKNEFSHPHDALQYPLAGLLHRSSGMRAESQPALPSADLLGRMRPMIPPRRATRAGFRVR